MIGMLSVGDPVQYRFQYPFQYPWGLATLLAPAFIYGILVYVTGYPAAGSADAALARRPLSRLPVAHQPVLSAAAASMIPSGPVFGKDHAQNEGSGHMSFVSTMIGTAERVPLPDVIIRAAIHRLCSRTATRLATGNTESDASFADEMAARAIAESHRRGQRPALRGAGGVLRPCARSEPQIFLVLLQGAGLHAAGGRRGGAAPDRRACRYRRRTIDPRTRLRLGFAVAVDGAAISACAGHGGVEFNARSANISKAKPPSAD